MSVISLCFGDTSRVLFDAANPAPRWNKIFVKGEFARKDFPGGKVTIGTDAFREMISNWKASGGNALPIDRFHWGDSQDTSISADDKDAVGFIEDLRIDNDGDLEGLTAWNDLGREKLLKDRLRYFSPAFSPNAVNRHTGKKQGFTLYGGALLNDPFLSELPRLAASAHLFPDRSATPEKPKMDKKLLLTALAAIGLTLSAEATDETIAEAIKKLGVERAAELEALKLSAASEKEKLVKLSATEKSTNETLKAALQVEVDAREALAKEVEKIKLAARESEISTLVDTLRRDRKIIAAEADDVKKIALAMGVSEAKRIFSARKPVVPEFGEKGVPGDPDEGVGEDSPEQASKKLELAAEELRKKDPKLPEADAYLRAIELNPKLALAAQPPATRVAIIKS